MRIPGKAFAAGKAKDVEIAVSLKYLSNFWRTLEISLINCEINLILTWSADCYAFCNWGNKICKSRYKTLFVVYNCVSSR